jgi:UDP-N-acetylmuramoyl-tripeptide--D-alanyl-D-alanine ligase
MRWERVAAGDRTIINDAYNANSLGMACVLETFRALPVAGRRVLVLGDMRELGAASEALHRAVGRSLPGGPWQVVVTVGACARWIADEAVAGGFQVKHVYCYDDAAAAAAAADVWTQPGDTILLKGSRGVGLERVAAALVAAGAG